MNKIKVDSTKSECLKCQHYVVCKYEYKKQDIISLLNKIEVEIQKPFKLELICPYFTHSGGF